MILASAMRHSVGRPAMGMGGGTERPMERLCLPPFEMPLIFARTGRPAPFQTARVLSKLNAGKPEPVPAYSLLPWKGGTPVKNKKQELTVQCFFAKEGEKLPELIMQSLRLYIESNLPKCGKI